MALKLSSGAKNALDTVLSLAGLVAGALASGAFKLPAPYDVASPIIGTIAGYAISDAVSYVDTGAAPTTTTVTTQVAAAYSLSRPLLAAEVAKLPANEQAQANLALTVIDDLVAKAKG